MIVLSEFLTRLVIGDWYLLLSCCCKYGHCLQKSETQASAKCFGWSSLV